MDTIPKAEYVWLQGNHDANILAQLRISDELRDLCDYRRHMKTFKYWKHLPYLYDRNKCVYRLGQVGFAHGFEASANSDEHQAYILGVPYGLMVFGHTHKPRDVEQAKRTQTLPIPWGPWYCNVGTMGRLMPRYMERKRNYTWGAAACVGEATILKSPRLSRSWEAQIIRP